ncbi:MAG TPA: hypothetical protein VKK81_22700 [Candidatus Binatia bacterium]|nr:hypothetical protein [Candidatus Binatia bacterium]
MQQHHLSLHEIGAVGCDQRDNAECTNQNFQHGKCNKCAGTEKEPA